MYVVFLIGTLRTAVASIVVSDAGFRDDESSRMVQRDLIGLRRSARAAGSVGGVHSTALNARSISARREVVDALADVRDASSLPMTVPSDISWREVVRDGCDWVHRPPVGRLDATGNMPAAAAPSRSHSWLWHQEQL